MLVHGELFNFTDLRVKGVPIAACFNLMSYLQDRHGYKRVFLAGMQVALERPNQTLFTLPYKPEYNFVQDSEESIIAGLRTMYTDLLALLKAELRAIYGSPVYGVYYVSFEHSYKLHITRGIIQACIVHVSLDHQECLRICTRLAIAAYRSGNRDKMYKVLKFNPHKFLTPVTRIDGNLI